MFDVKKLAKLLKEIFTRDNENFSPELIAQEVDDRKLEVIAGASDNRDMKDYGSEVNSSTGGKLTDEVFKSMGFNSNYKERGAAGPNALVNYMSNRNYGGPYILDTNKNKKVIDCVVIGKHSTCEHNNSVVIGNNQKSDKPNQLKIGNNDISVSRDITDEEFQEILATFKSVREFLPSKHDGDI